MQLGPHRLYQQITTSQASSSSSTLMKINPERWEFANEGFLRGQKHLLRTIKRRKPPTTDSLPSEQEPSACIEIGRFGLDVELDHLKRDKQVVMMELVKLRRWEILASTVLKGKLSFPLSFLSLPDFHFPTSNHPLNIFSPGFIELQTNLGIKRRIICGQKLRKVAAEEAKMEGDPSCCFGMVGVELEFSLSSYFKKIPDISPLPFTTLSYANGILELELGRVGPETIMSFAALTQPEIAKNVEAAALLSPISYLEHITAPLIILVSGFHELNFKSDWGIVLLDNLCDRLVNCINVLSSITGKGKAFNNTRVKHRVKWSIKVPTISNKLADMMIIHGGNMAKSQSKVLRTQD
ncbi:triacylglycerol lipase 1 isoform X2 [Cucumis melo var. makuwa]|uniref:Triacylglycerol lipase 1 isoform X2 n=1 Tax=Cucumis melo var. makuwa TaxID=1194695 RepID=A0A5A7TKJ7_CUCMM|nr:triacylglycerol lipase 1 isoform X2 [Cucumis melo var. makuwa]